MMAEALSAPPVPDRTDADDGCDKEPCRYIGNEIPDGLADKEEKQRADPVPGYQLAQGEKGDDDRAKTDDDVLEQYDLLQSALHGCSALDDRLKCRCARSCLGAGSTFCDDRVSISAVSAAKSAAPMWNAPRSRGVSAPSTEPGPSASYASSTEPNGAASSTQMSFMRVERTAASATISPRVDLSAYRSASSPMTSRASALRTA